MAFINKAVGLVNPAMILSQTKKNRMRQGSNKKNFYHPNSQS